MRVWQPGSHLTDRGKRVSVDDWSLAATKRRVGTLARLAAPYKLRTALSVLALLGATAVALLPPVIAGLAIDKGIREHDLDKLHWYVAAFVVTGLLALSTGFAETYFTGWTGERILADLRMTLFRH